MKTALLQPAIQHIIAAERSRELRLLELRIESFMKRTGLSNNEITLVHYRDKCFPQWNGALPWKKAEKWIARTPEARP